MRMSDHLRLGWDQLRRRIVVTALCAIGIAIGSASIIVALAFGESISYYSQKQMGFYLKTDEINVSQKQMSTDALNNGVGPDRNQTGKITQEKMNLIRSLPHVVTLQSVNHLGQFEFTVDSSKKGFLNDVTATELNTLSEFGSEFYQGYESELDNAIIISYGSMLNVFDEQTARKKTQQRQNNSQASGPSQEETLIAYPLYQKQLTLRLPQRNNNGTATTKLEFPVRVMGVFKKPEGTPDRFLQSQAYVSRALGQKIREAQAAAMPNQPAQERNNEIGEIVVKVDATANVAQVEQAIQKLKLDTRTNLNQQERMKGEFVIVRLIFAGIGLFVLFVASISIVVAMTMSTYQRRRQIGIMKVLGANLSQIRNMFIVESTLLGFVGGLLGILTSYWVIWAINIAAMKFSPPRQDGNQELLFISAWILPVGLFFALLTGVLSGIYPAIKASKTDALTAIKRD